MTLALEPKAKHSRPASVPQTDPAASFEPVPPPDPDQDGYAPCRFTRRQYEHLSDLGWFDGRSVEMIDGVIYLKPVQKNRHRFGVSLSDRTLRRVFGERDYWISVQSTQLLDDLHLPDPDLCVIRGSIDDRPADEEFTPVSLVVLVVEVSDTTLADDRRVKASLYARYGIAEYLIVNVRDRLAELHRDPRPDRRARFGHRYASRQTFGPGEAFAFLERPDVPVRVDDLMKL